MRTELEAMEGRRSKAKPDGGQQGETTDQRCAAETSQQTGSADPVGPGNDFRFGVALGVHEAKKPFFLFLFFDVPKTRTCLSKARIAIYLVNRPLSSRLMMAYHVAIVFAKSG